MRCSAATSALRLSHAALYFDRAAHGVDHARELHQHAVAGDPHHPPVVLGYLGLDEVTPVRFPACERPLLVHPDDAAVAGHVGEEYG